MKSFWLRITAIVLVLLLLTGCGPLVGNATLNGAALDQYTIVYSQSAPDYCQRAAEYIQKEILARTGHRLSVCQAESGVYDHEIVVGETDRAISAQLTAETKNVEFALLSDGNHIAMEGDYFIIAAAAYYFVETYIPGKSFTSEVPQEISVQAPIQQDTKNIIFLIGDGMGFYHTKMFDHFPIPSDVNFYDGEKLFYGYYLPYQGMAHTNSLSGVTDSAAAATALACGYKTINSYVGKDQDGNDLQSLTELAISQGKATAVLSTDINTGATPGGFSAHAMNREDSAVILACQQKLMLDSGTLIDCGLHTLKTYQNHITDALDLLDSSADGFFLMYEEGHIDKFSHKMDAQGTFTSVIRFNQAIGLFMEYAFYHPDTLVLITADHETGGLAPDQEGKLTYSTENHTGADVPVFAYGAGAEVFRDFSGENTEIPKKIAAMWGVTDFGE